MSMQNLKKVLRKTWHFIWEDNSIWSWLVNIVLAFVLIKYIVYPGLGLILGTSHPIVAVVSGSMEHEGSFDKWWSSKCCLDLTCTQSFAQSEFYAERNINRQIFQSFPFKNGFNKGDMMVLFSPKKAELGEIVVFTAQHRTDPIIHRVVGIKKDNVLSFATKGDHNCGSAEFEENIREDMIIGKAVLRIPLLGWIKILFVEFVNVFGA